MSRINFNVSELDDLFQEAAETERKLPAAIRRQTLRSWPDYPTEWSGYGYHDASTPMLRATTAEVTRYEIALEISVSMMDEEDRRLVWAVAHSAAFRERGPAWLKLAKLMGLGDPRAVKRRYRDALLRLYYRV